MYAARPLAAASDDFCRPPLRPRLAEVAQKPAFVSSQSHRRSLPGISLPQGRCRDRGGRRPDSFLSMQLQCTSFRQYPTLERLVKAASSGSDRTSFSRRSSPRSAEPAPSAEENIESAAESPEESHRSLNSLTTVQSMEVPADDASGAEPERIPEPVDEPMGFLRRAWRFFWVKRQ
mmetsp:Transcript_2453/g.5830  ORF Transcript_2453/g.5830 Transcript_2453/m.5830 type:complete len:176 (+) Transcript_2453:45-572(+)